MTSGMAKTRSKVVKKGAWNWRCLIFGHRLTLKTCTPFLDCIYQCEQCGEITHERYEDW